MPTGSQLKNRLTLWSLGLLVLLLGAGGFFCYHSQQQQLLDHLDKQLLSIAGNFACSYREVDEGSPATANFCQDFKRLTIYQGGKQAATLYSAQGKVLCSNRLPLSQQLSLSPASAASSSAGQASFETIGNAPDPAIRRLTSPILVDGLVRYHLQLGQSLEEIDQRLSQYALRLIIAGLLTTIGLIFGQWILLGRIFTPLTELSRLMDHANEENLQTTFPPSPLPGSELRQLAASYNSLAARLDHSLKRARRFATDVTHELRTPLTILRGETELALRGNKDAEELCQVLNSNLEEISRMGHLVEDLLLLSKSELGEVPLKMEALNLNDLLEELHFHGSIIAEPKQIKVELHGPEQQVNLFADGHRIRQVFLNLLTNGIKYTPEGGTVSIDWSLQEKAVRVIFKDTGIGIDGEHQRHIFDRFYRIDKTSNCNDGGSGLGLAIAKWLVEAHGGSIMVCSVAGQGSSFAIILPLASGAGSSSR